MAEKEKVVLLTWKQARAWVIHLPQSGGLLNAIARSTDPNSVITAEEAEKALREARPMLIIPGTNEYSAALWELVKNHPDVKNYMKDGQLTLETKGELNQKLKEGETPETPATSLPASLGKVDAGKARDLAEHCDDLDTLNTWLKAEEMGDKRSSVIDALKNKIDIVQENDKRFEGTAD